MRRPLVTAVKYGTRTGLGDLLSRIGVGGNRRPSPTVRFAMNLKIVLTSLSVVVYTGLLDQVDRVALADALVILVRYRAARDDRD